MCSKEKTDSSTTTQHLEKTAEQLKAEVESLKSELKKVKGISQRRTGLALIVIGALSLAAAVLNNSYVLAFIGLALTFGGALLFFVKPVRYVQGDLLALTAISTYVTVDRLMKDLKFKGKSYYIALSPQAYPTKYFDGIENLVVFIAANSHGTPPIEKNIESKFLLKNPHGVCVAPPGSGLLKQFEKELKDTSKFEPRELCGILPPLIVDDLRLAKNMKMQARDNHVYLKISNSVYKDLYVTEQKLNSVHSLGCPLVSAIACAIAKAAGKIVTVEGQKSSDNGQEIEVWYRIIK